MCERTDCSLEREKDQSRSCIIIKYTIDFLANQVKVTGDHGTGHVVSTQEIFLMGNRLEESVVKEKGTAPDLSNNT